MVVLLGWWRRASRSELDAADMTPFDCADKLDNSERLVHYDEQ